MLVTYFVGFWVAGWPPVCGGGVFVLFAAGAFRGLSSIYVFSYFPFGFEGRIWDLIASVPDHCLSFYLEKKKKKKLAIFINQIFMDPKCFLRRVHMLN